MPKPHLPIKQWALHGDSITLKQETFQIITKNYPNSFLYMKVQVKNHFSSEFLENIAILLSRIDRRTGREHHQENLTVINVQAANSRASKYIKEKKDNIKGKGRKVCNFHTR